MQTFPSATVSPIDAEALAPKSASLRIDFDDFVPWARLVRPLKAHLSLCGPASVDMPVLLQDLAARKPLVRLPLLRVPRWGGELTVFVDFNETLRPVRHDMHRLAARLVQLVGRSRASIRIVPYGPWGSWLDWGSQQGQLRRLIEDQQHSGGVPIDDEDLDLAHHAPIEHAWSMPTTGSKVLLVSDFGLASSRRMIEAKAWTEFAQHLLKAGHQVFSLMPIGDEQSPPVCFRGLPALSWAANPMPVRASLGVTQVSDESINFETLETCVDPGSARFPQPDLPGLDDLLAMMSVCRRVDPPLLRALRKLLPTGSMQVNLELAAWNHPDVQITNRAVAAIVPRRVDHYAQRIRHWPLALQEAIWATRDDHHAHLRAWMTQAEQLLMAAYVHKTVRLAHEADLAKADEFVQRLAAMAQALKDGAVLAEDAHARRWADTALDWVRGLDEATAAGAMPALRKLVRALATPQRLKRALTMPAWADEASLRSVQANAGDVWPIWLVEDRELRMVRLQPNPPGPWQTALAKPFDANVVGIRLKVKGSAEKRFWTRISAQGVNLAPLAGAGDATTTGVLRGLEEELEFGSIERPKGVVGFGAEMEQGCRIVTAMFADLEGEGQRYRLDEVGDSRSIEAYLYAPSGAPKYVLSYESPAGEILFNYGIDSPHGAYLDLTIKNTTQRFRYIEPGTFLMGSPDDEPGRFNNEGPQHPVTMTEGYWIADTPCTVDFWRAWTGQTGGFRVRLKRNSGQHPVVEVSWDDIQAQLPKLRDIISSTVFEPALPTEAQWEYACRAGTNTAFWFGSAWSHDYGNISRKDGDYDVNNHTTEVHRYPPNPWGLYDMHGNVWEWCDGYRRDYSREGLADPPDQQLPGRRVLRGGSWSAPAQLARAAFRFASLRTVRDGDVGFRLVLRSIEHQPGGGAASTGFRAAEPPVPEGRGPAVGSLSQVWDKLKGAVGLKGLGDPAPSRPRGSAAAPKNQSAAKKKK